MHRESYDLMKKFAKGYLDAKKDEKLTILDIGALDINGTYQDLFKVFPKWKYFGVDFQPGKNVSILLNDPLDWTEKIQTEHADVLISGQAIEHMPLFWKVFKEMKRVLKKGGLMCIIAPSRGPEHRQPVDCYRFLPDGFMALCDETGGLTVIECRLYDKGVWGDTVLVARKK